MAGKRVLGVVVGGIRVLWMVGGVLIGIRHLLVGIRHLLVVWRHRRIHRLAIGILTVGRIGRRYILRRWGI